MKPDIKLIKDEKLIYRYNKVKGLINLHYNTVIITNFRIIMIYAYKPWWYYWLFIVKPNEISNTTIFTKYISSIKIKTRPLTSTILSPFRNFFTKKPIGKYDNEHYVRSNNYFPQRRSFEEIIFKSFLRSLVFGIAIAVVIWKFVNASWKFIIIQWLVCILINLLYDFKSYTQVKYLEIHTLDGTGDISVSHNSRVRRKTHINCIIYHDSRNTYIIEGEMDELVFLRDKITTAIKECSIQPCFSNKLKENKILKNKDSSKIGKHSENVLSTESNNEPLKTILKTPSKKYKKTSSIRKRQVELKQQNDEDSKENIMNLLNKEIELNDKIKNKLIQKKKEVEKIQIENTDTTGKPYILIRLFGLLFSFIKFAILIYLSAIVLLILMYNITISLEQTN